MTQADVDASLKALKDARLALVKVDSKPTPPTTKPDGNENSGASINNGSGTNTGLSGNSKNGSGDSSNNDQNAGKLVNTNHIINKSDGVDNTNGKLPQAGERDFIMASLLGVEIMLICGVAYLVKKRKEMI